MSIFRRIMIVFATAGWLLPLCTSYTVSYDFIWNVVWPAAAFGKPSTSPWHPFSYADDLFYFSMPWLAAVLIGWSIALTRRIGKS